MKFNYRVVTKTETEVILTKNLLLTITILTTGIMKLLYSVSAFLKLEMCLMGFICHGPNSLHDHLNGIKEKRLHVGV